MQHTNQLKQYPVLLRVIQNLCAVDAYSFLLAINHRPNIRELLDQVKSDNMLDFLARKLGTDVAQSLLQDLSTTNAIISGSAVLQALTGAWYPNSDVDIFCTPADMNAVTTACQRYYQNTSAMKISHMELYDVGGITDARSVSCFGILNLIQLNTTDLKKCILRRFDISVCTSTFSPKTLHVHTPHFHDIINKRAHWLGHKRSTRRTIKYLHRGYQLKRRAYPLPFSKRQRLE